MADVVQRREFLEPWYVLLMSTSEAFGFEADTVKVMSPVYKAADVVIDALNTGYSISSSSHQAIEAIRNADFLLSILYGFTNVSKKQNACNLLGVMVPDSFWSSYSGRCISNIYNIALPKDEYVNLSKAAAFLAVSVRKLYRLSEKMEMPFLLDFNVVNPKHRKKFRLDLVKHGKSKESFLKNF